MALPKMMATIILTLWMMNGMASEIPTLSNDAYVARMAAATRVAWPALATSQNMENETGFYADAQILVSDGSHAWLIDAAGYRKVDPGPVQALGLPHTYYHFGKIEWQHRPTVYIGLGEELPADEAKRVATRPPALFLLATHEAFHFYGQKKWPVTGSDETDDSRATAYPSQIPPRQYRNQLIRNLIAAVQGQAGALGKARYWHQRWQTEFPAEARNIRYTDISEGTAMYVEVLAELLAAGDVPDARTWSAAIMEELSKTTDKFQADYESYPLGALAGYLLDRQGVKWWQRAVNGETPVQILLDPVAAIAELPDAELDQRIEKILNALNQSLAPVMDAFVQNMQAADAIRLLVPMTSGTGSVRMSGQYRVANLSEEVFTDYFGEFAPAGGSVKINKEMAAMAVSNACGDTSGFLILPFPAGTFPLAVDGRLQLQRKGIEIDVPYPVKSADDEKIWCVQA